MTKYTLSQWQKLSREEKRNAILSFKEPDFIHTQEYVDMDEVDKKRYE